MLFTMPYIVTAFGHSDTGCVRQNNEDAWGKVEQFPLFVLADGMGGHRAGEVAAKESVERLCALMSSSLCSMPQCTLADVEYSLCSAICMVNAEIYALGQSSEHLRGMGTTVCCAYFHPEGIVCAHVGDSRIYRLRDRKLEQLTTDHSLVRELIDLGQLSEQQAGDFLYKNIITRAIGTEPFVEPSISIQDVRIGDLYLMCTDGLSDQLNKEEMETILQRPQKLHEITHDLLFLATQRGGYDNITVVLMAVEPKK